MTKAKVIVEDDSADDSSDTGSESERELPNHHNLSNSQSDLEQLGAESKYLLNEGWADSIAKILKTNKLKKRKTLVLSKAKKLTDPTKKIRTENYEIATVDGQVKKEQTVIVEKVIERDGPLRKKKRELKNIRMKPNILEKDMERTLQKIATKGAVQFFNAVKDACTQIQSITA